MATAVHTGCLTKGNPLHGEVGGSDSEDAGGPGTATVRGPTTSGTSGTTQSTDGTFTTTDGPGTTDGTTTDTDGAGYAYRRRFIVTADAEGPVAAGSALSFSVDTEAEISAGRLRADEADFRILRCDGNVCQERARWVDGWSGQGWNTSETWTWFRVDEDLAPRQSETRYYIYYGNPQPPGEPVRKMDAVFFFGDDFEGDLSKWSANGEGESFGVETNQVGVGLQSLRIEPGAQSAGGVYRDVERPSVPLVFSVLLHAEPGNASFAFVRGGMTPYNARAPSWNEESLRVHCEFDASPANLRRVSAGLRHLPLGADRFGRRLVSPRSGPRAADR